MSHTQLLQRCRSIKRRFLDMYFHAKAGHIGSSLSCAEILTCVGFAWMAPEDQMVLSKGHAAAALYSMLAEQGHITPEEIASFYQNGTLLSAHPPANRLPGIPFATGSLGHGLSLASGLALANKLGQKSRRVFCITSDGELNEGSTWEAALFAAHHNLSQMLWIIDRNGIQGVARTEEVIKLEPLRDKLRAFGWLVTEADGHSFVSLLAAEKSLRKRGGMAAKPQVMIARTIKGHGYPDLEDTVDSHYLPMSEAQYRRALDAI